MKSARLLLMTLLASVVLVSPVAGAEPDYSAWTEILRAYYDPARGVDYERLRKEDYPKLTSLVEKLSRVDVSSLDRSEQLAYWMNLYNVSTVKLIVDNYPVESILDLSTSLINKYQVFDREVVPLGGSLVSLNHIEHEIIRKEFDDPRIHFAINCAARSCPPMRTEAFSGRELDDQLEEQTSTFLNQDVRIDRKGGKATITVTKIMDWFEEDFEKAGGVASFVRGYLTGESAARLSGVSRIGVKHADYDWSLNDWK
jgi:hypothetical protein